MNNPLYMARISVVFDDDEDLYDRVIEKNRYRIVKYIEPSDFYDALREKAVFNIDDQEEIQTKFYNRRKRAAGFLDLLQKKGTTGTQAFLDILELEYPEVYKDITGEEPRKPPPNFIRRGRFSTFQLPQRMASIMLELREKNKNNQELMKKLEDMDGILKYEQNENRELEKETEEMRKQTRELNKITELIIAANKEETEEMKKQIRELSKSKTNLELIMAKHVQENQKLKDDSLKHLQTSLEYAKQCDSYRDRWLEVQKDKDDLERTLHERREDLSASGSSFGSLGKDSAKDSSPNSSVYRPTLKHQTAVDSQRGEEERQILRETLEEMQEHSEEVVSRLHSVQGELDDCQKRFDRSQKDLDKMRRERDQLDQLLQQHSKRNDSYFEMIETLQKEKNELEQERRNEQKKVSEETEKYRSLFAKLHQLEKEHLELMQEHQKLKAEIHKRDSQSTNSSKESDCEMIYCINNDNSSVKSSEQTPNLPDDKIKVENPDVCEFSDVTLRKKPNVPCQLFFPAKLPLERSSTTKGLDGEEDEGDRTISGVYDNRNNINSIAALSLVHAGQAGFNSSDETCDDPPGSPSSPGQRRDTNFGCSQYSLPFCQFSVGSDDADSNHEIVVVFLPTFTIPRQLLGTSTITVKLDVSVLEQIECTGGNVVGIYIKWFRKKPDKPIDIGDKILSIGEFISNGETDDAKHTYMTNRTMEEAKNIIQSFTNGKGIPKCLGRTIELKVERNPAGYEAAQNWMSKHQDSGDFFYVKSTSSLDGEQGTPVIEKNDVYCVISTTQHPKYWKALKFDSRCNTFCRESVSIPNSSQFIRLIRKNPKTPATATLDRPKKRECMKYRPYHRVLPVKACMGMVISNSSGGHRPAQPLPLCSQYQEQIHWRQESNLTPQEAEKYRYLLGQYSKDSSTSFSDSDTPLYSRSYSVPNIPH